MEPDPPGDPRPRSRPPRDTGARAQLRYALAAAAALLIVAGVLVAILDRSSEHASSTPAASVSAPPARASLPACGAVCDPIDPRYLTDLKFGTTSFWIQPWRAYLDTWPASRLLDAVGINFNVRAAQAQDVARLLHESGFKLARVGINWNALSYSDPSKFAHEADVRTRLLALHRNDLRPLILLDANSGAPCPSEKIVLETVSPAPAGASTVTLSRASAAEAIPGKTGFASIVFNPSRKHRHRTKTGARAALTRAQRRARHEARRAAARAHGLTHLVLSGDPAILITKVSASGVATLSRPLPFALAPGPHKGVTLLYAPFASPTLPSGAANPAFRATLDGWLHYVATVSKLAAEIFGPGGYDFEVWNELSFGSQFLDAEKYYSPSGESDSKAVTDAVTKALLRETVAYIRDPANGISPNVGITDGFASQTPFASGASAPAGLTALSKHPYADLRILPAEYKIGPGRVPYDALGQRDTVGPRGSTGAFTPLFVPHYQELFPEYFLTAVSAETMIRDIAPITTSIHRTPHGRYASRAHHRPLQVWVTEYNLGTGKASPVGPDEMTPQTGGSATLTRADKEHFQAKALLRSLVAMVGKGVAREYFYAAALAGDLSMVSKSFMSAVEANPSVYPGDRLGGETMDGFRNLVSHFQGPGPGPAGARQLKLLSITQGGDHAQFSGNGTAANPSLYDREVLAVFPFQSSPTTFVIPVYVMTRDLLTLYEPNAPSTDVRRFDLPDETFHITLGNLPTTSTPPTVSAYDPLRNTSTPVRLIARRGSTATFEVAATDYPRLLTIEYAHKS
jgi:hypothetical protein